MQEPCDVLQGPEMDGPLMMRSRFCVRSDQRSAKKENLSEDTC